MTNSTILGDYFSELIVLDALEMKKWQSVSPSVIFIKEGELQFIINQMPGRHIHSGQMFYLPSENSCSLTGLSTSEVLIFRMADPISICFNYIPLFKYKKYEFTEKAPYPLEMNSFVELIVGDIWCYTKENLNAPFILYTKACEFFYILNCCYSKEQLSLFLEPLIEEII